MHPKKKNLAAFPSLISFVKCLQCDFHVNFPIFHFSFFILHFNYLLKNLERHNDCVQIPFNSTNIYWCSILPWPLATQLTCFHGLSPAPTQRPSQTRFLVRVPPHCTSSLGRGNCRTFLLNYRYQLIEADMGKIKTICHPNVWYFLANFLLLILLRQWYLRVYTGGNQLTEVKSPTQMLDITPTAKSPCPLTFYNKP